MNALGFCFTVKMLWIINALVHGTPFKKRRSPARLPYKMELALGRQRVESAFPRLSGLGLLLQSKAVFVLGLRCNNVYLSLKNIC